MVCARVSRRISLQSSGPAGNEMSESTLTGAFTHVVSFLLYLSISFTPPGTIICTVYTEQYALSMWFTCKLLANASLRPEHFDKTWLAFVLV